MLGGVGFHTLTAFDGEACLETMEKIIPHVILLDVKMPNMSGYDVIKWIRSHHLYKELVVLMMTSMNKKSDVIDFLKLGADDYIVKPAPIVTLQEKISAHLRKQKNRVVKSVRFIKAREDFKPAASTTVTVPIQVKGLGENGFSFCSRLKFKPEVTFRLNSTFFDVFKKPPLCTVQDCGAMLKSQTDFISTVRVVSPSTNRLVSQFLINRLAEPPTRLGPEKINQGNLIDAENLTVESPGELTNKPELPEEEI